MKVNKPIHPHLKKINNYYVKAQNESLPLLDRQLVILGMVEIAVLYYEAYCYGDNIREIYELTLINKKAFTQTNHDLLNYNHKIFEEHIRSSNDNETCIKTLCEKAVYYGTGIDNLINWEYNVHKYTERVIRLNLIGEKKIISLHHD